MLIPDSGRRGYQREYIAGGGGFGSFFSKIGNAAKEIGKRAIIHSKTAVGHIIQHGKTHILPALLDAGKEAGRALLEEAKTQAKEGAQRVGAHIVENIGNVRNTDDLKNLLASTKAAAINEVQNARGNVINRGREEAMKLRQTGIEHARALKTVAIHQGKQVLANTGQSAKELIAQHNPPASGYQFAPDENGEYTEEGSGLRKRGRPKGSKNKPKPKPANPVGGGLFLAGTRGGGLYL
jgi:hypothetical protein